MDKEKERVLTVFIFALCIFIGGIVMLILDEQVAPYVLGAAIGIPIAIFIEKGINKIT